MLNFVRENKKKLKWVLWPVIIGLTVGMMLMFTATPAKDEADRTIGTFVVKVDDTEISENSLRSNLIMFLNSQNLRNRQDPEILKQYGRILLGQMVQIVVSSKEAMRLGFEVTDEEVQKAIVNSPAFGGANGFVGVQAYLRILRRLGTTSEDYEEDTRRILLNQKLQNFITSACSVSQEEIRQYFDDQNSYAKIRFVTVPFSKQISKIDTSDAKLQDYFAAHSENYKIDVSRQIQYILLDPNKLINVFMKNIPELELKVEYDSNKDAMYKEEVRASHILIKVPADASSEQEEGLRKKAQDILEQAKQPNAAFSELAVRYSEDTGSAQRGGDLNFFPKNRMLKEFDEVAFTLEPGQVSDLVKTQFGFHIIKVTGKKDFDFYKNTIARKLAREKAEGQLRLTADKALEKAKTTKDLVAVANEFEGTVETSKPFNKKNPDHSLPRNIVDDIFKLEIDEIGELFEAPRGFIIPKLIKIIEPHIPEFKDVKSKVLYDYRNEESKRLAQDEAERFIEEAKKDNDFETTAQKFDLEVTTSKKFNLIEANDREKKPLDPLTKPNAVASRALHIEKVEIGGPIESTRDLIVFQVLEREEADADKFPKEKDKIANSILSTKQEKLFRTFLSQLMTKYQSEDKIIFNEKRIERILG